MSELPKILVIYFTQTGQLKTVIDAVLSPIVGQADITYEQLESEKPWEFPWSKQTFYDTMPETVQGKPRGIKPLKVDPATPFDLVILAYQPWFLSPSQPTAAFLQSPEAARLLKGKPVVTLMGCRNMWLNAQEKVKGYLQQAGATLVGNIVLVDRSSNLVSLLTVLRWLFKGKKEATTLLPPAGIQAADINAASRFGPIIGAAAASRQFSDLQDQLMAQQAVSLKPNLVVLEARGIRAFRYWAKFISDKGGPGSPERQPRVRMYRGLLVLGIFVLTPITLISSWYQLTFKKQHLLKEVEYYKGVSKR
ncbi:hypothetical protein GA0116948_103368 [Chitinophaga costaii]|uniref:Dialkylrecorsinol condensing enzyme n=1 Tax=Chitinophaga costaii TaxID=1335309 RepID=A0A1C4C2J1_9BACT|nr:hypothetical protein [Chitinophaga costaii]PUZ27366.1 dialkylresorcinol condensing enzyme DarA [Chitinophaga costaii]SCC13193.1 hypothetical protein GA0116948_103368 [Chitinophaga costaii]